MNEPLTYMTLLKNLVLRHSDTPFENITPEGWRECESQIGTVLPSDYKELIETYGGASAFGGHILVYSPFCPDPAFNLLREIRLTLASRREQKERRIDQFPWPLWPDKGGWLPWGGGANGETMWWQTVGTQEQWGVAISEGRGPRVDYYPGPMTQVLYGLLSKRERCRMFPPRFPRQLKFEPLGMDWKRTDHGTTRVGPDMDA